MVCASDRAVSHCSMLLLGGSDDCVGGARSEVSRRHLWGSEVVYLASKMRERGVDWETKWGEKRKKRK